LITGAAPNTFVARVDGYVAGELYPTSSAMPVAVMDYPKPGSSTTKCVANLILREPRL